MRVVERFDAQRIAGKKKNGHRGVTLAQIEQRKSKHAAQFGEALFAPLFPGMHEYFGVGLRGEAVAAKKEGFTQLAIVVEFAVENDRDVVGFVPDGLVAAGQINNA